MPVIFQMFFQGGFMRGGSGVEVMMPPRADELPPDIFDLLAPFGHAR